MNRFWFYSASSFSAIALPWATSFDDIIGVILLDEKTPKETFVLRFEANRFPYVLSKPLHSSQEVVNMDNHVISIKVKPNNELRQLIFSFIPDIEVISPAWFTLWRS